DINAGCVTARPNCASLNVGDAISKLCKGPMHGQPAVSRFTKLLQRLLPEGRNVDRYSVPERLEPELESAQPKVVACEIDLLAPKQHPYNLDRLFQSAEWLCVRQAVEVPNYPGAARSQSQPEAAARNLVQGSDAHRNQCRTATEHIDHTCSQADPLGLHRDLSHN